MSSTNYENLVGAVKVKLLAKRLGFKRIFKMANKKEFDKIDILTKNDNDIRILIKDIEFEQNEIGKNLDSKLNDLLWLNEQLVRFGEQSQVSKNKALKILQTKVFINIYDLNGGRYEKRTTKQLLIKDMNKNCDRIFPLAVAKKHFTLKCYLRKRKYPVTIKLKKTEIPCDYKI